MNNQTRKQKQKELAKQNINNNASGALWVGGIKIVEFLNEVNFFFCKWFSYLILVSFKMILNLFIIDIIVLQ